MKFNKNTVNIKLTENKVIRRKLILILVAFGIAVYLIIKSFDITPLFAQDSNVNVRVTPAQADLKQNDVKTIKVSLAGNNPISGFDLRFQTEGVEIIDIYDQLISNKQAIAAESRKVIEDMNANGARVSYIYLANENLPSNIDLYLKIRGGGDGNGKISIDTGNSQILTLDGETAKIGGTGASYNLVTTNSSGTFISEALPAEILPPNSAVIRMRVRLLGINGYPAGEIKNLNAIIVAVGRVGEVMYESQVTQMKLFPEQNGMFSAKAVIPDFKDGTKFSLMVKVDNYLLKRICDTSPKEEKPNNYICNDPALTIRKGENSFDFTGITLMPGDLGLADGILNGYDLAIVRNNIGKKELDVLKVADLNLDGIVDKTDFGLISYSVLHTTGANDQ